MNSLLTALTTIRRSPYQALTAILITSITFLVAFCFSLLLIGAEKVLQYFETRPQVIAFFELDTPHETIVQVEQTMQARPYVEEVTVIDKETALKLYREAHRDEPLLLELVTADILPASIEVSAVDLQSLPRIKNDLEQAPGVEDVEFQEQIIDQLSAWTRSIRLLGLGAVAVLGLISFLNIAVIIAMKAAVKKPAIGIMRLLGATRGFIKMPFMLEGMIYGVTGVTLGWLGMYAVLLYSTPTINQFLGEIRLLPVPVEFLGLQLAAGLFLGLCLGGFAGLVAVGRLIKR